jgi:hypothetical protein
MKEEHRVELIEIYPEMFSWSYRAEEKSGYEQFYNKCLSSIHKRFRFTRKINYIKQVNPYNFGFGVGDGWYGILKELIIGIKAGDSKEKNNWITKVTQCKEKFGGLRFYVTGTSKKNWDLIRKAEDKSMVVCEETGSEVEVGTWNDGWVKTICRKKAFEMFALGNYGKRTFEQLWTPKEKAVTITTKRKNGQKS